MYPPGRGMWWSRMVLTNIVKVTWAQMYIEFSRVFCNRLSSFFRCNPPMPLMLSMPLVGPNSPYTPAGPQCPHQYRYLVIKSGTTAGQHDMSSACGSGCCFVRCTPSPHAPSMPPGRGIWWPRVVLTEVLLTWAHVLLSAIDHLEFSRVLCNRPYSFLICSPQCPLNAPTPPVIPLTPPPHPYRHQVVMDGATAGQHDLSSACGSDWCLVRCTHSPTHTPGRGI